MTRKRGRCVARPRHPVTGRPMYVSAATPGQLAAYVNAITRMREDLRAGAVSADEVTRKLERRRHVTLERALRGYMETDIAANTRRRVASSLSTHLAELAPLELHDLDAARMGKWIEGLRRKGLAGATVRLQWRTVGAALRYASERGWIARAPWGTWRPSARGGRPGSDRLPREATRTPRELHELLEAARWLDATDDRAFPRGLEARIGCAALLGLRQGELAGLRWSDVDFEGGAVAIVRQGGGELPKQRTVDVLQGAARLFEVLSRWRFTLKAGIFGLYDPAGPVFPWPMHYAGLAIVARPYPARAEVLTSTALRRAVVRAGLPNPDRWTPHSLRDSFVTLEAAASGGDLARVAPRYRGTVRSLVRYLRALERGPAAARPGFELPVDGPAPALLEAAPFAKTAGAAGDVGRHEDLVDGLGKAAGVVDELELRRPARNGR